MAYKNTNSFKCNTYKKQGEGYPCSFQPPLLFLLRVVSFLFSTELGLWTFLYRVSKGPPQARTLV